MKWIKQILLFFSCFAWTQHLLSLSTLSLWNNINKERILKRKNTGSLAKSTPHNKKPKQQQQSQCFSCKKEFTLRALTQHLESNVCQKNYSCTTFPCEGTEVFRSRDELKKHMMKYEKIHKFQCSFDECDIIFSDQYCLKTHEKNHSLNTGMVCFLCLKKYKSLTSLRNHTNSYHNPKHPFKCDICKFTYSNQELLLRHTAIHIKTYTNTLYCGLCLDHPTYSTLGNLKQHTQVKHSYYKCKYKDCKEAFFLGSLLHLHMEKEHDFTSLPCPECHQLFHGTLTLYQHRYMEHEKDNKDDFIEFIKDLIKNDLSCSYPFYQEHPFFNSLFLEKKDLIDNLLDLEPMASSKIPIETLRLYKQFIENITSENFLPLKELSLDELFSYECYRIYLSGDDSVRELLLLKEILSVMIKTRKSLKTTYKEMLDILYTKDTKQFSNQEYLLFMKEFTKKFFKKFVSPATLQAHEKDGLRTERSVIDKTLEDPNISLQESINTIGSPVEKTSEYDLKNIENDLNNLNDFHQGKIFPFEKNDETPSSFDLTGRHA